MKQNTALRASNSKNHTHIIFKNQEHEEFYYSSLKNCRYQDSYHEALCYCLGISDDTRRNVNRIYDFKTGYIKTECLHDGWQTSGSLKIVRLAFNLYTDGVPTVEEDDSHEEQLDECRQYSVSDLFCCSYAKYFCQAIGLRYPEYVNYRSMEEILYGQSEIAGNKTRY